MGNKDITEWLLDKGIKPSVPINVNGRQWILSDILEQHLKEQLSLIQKKKIQSLRIN